MMLSLFVTSRVTVRALTHKKSLSTFPRKPVILLDVDGVVNMAKGDCGWADKVITEVYGYSIGYSPTVIKKINEWNAIAEVRWLTSWDSKAQSLLAPALGLDKFPLGRVREVSDPNERLAPYFQKKKGCNQHCRGGWD